MIRSSGLGTFQTSLTPSSHTWGSRFAPRSNSLIAAPVRWPQQPSASTVTSALMSVPGSKFRSGSPSLPRPLSPERAPRARPPPTTTGAAPEDVPPVDDQLRGRGLGEDIRPALLGHTLLVARQRRHGDDLVAVV